MGNVYTDCVIFKNVLSQVHTTREPYLFCAFATTRLFHTVAYHRPCSFYLVVYGVFPNYCCMSWGIISKTEIRTKRGGCEFETGWKAVFTRANNRELSLGRLKWLANFFYNGSKCVRVGSIKTSCYFKIFGYRWFICMCRICRWNVR